MPPHQAVRAATPAQPQPREASISFVPAPPSGAVGRPFPLAGVVLQVVRGVWGAAASEREGGVCVFWSREPALSRGLGLLAAAPQRTRVSQRLTLREVCLSPQAPWSARPGVGDETTGWPGENHHCWGTDMEPAGGGGWRLGGARTGTGSKIWFPTGSGCSARFCKRAAGQPEKNCTIMRAHV